MPVPDLMLEHLHDAIRDVFKAMVFRDVQTLPARAERPAPADGPCVVATVAFAGSRSGVVLFTSSADTARGIVGSMLNIPKHDVNGEVADGIGEIANLIAGSFRTRMAQSGPPWAISVPTVIIGSALETRFVANVSRASVPIEMQGERAYVDLVLNR
ncbi:MAG TPA: chemotaxis protein CheX [Vicinamibacterales bacterium]|nr:chemotaxis protein CheX [Vicinamibacterales bacterium]